MILVLNVLCMLVWSEQAASWGIRHQDAEYTRPVLERREEGAPASIRFSALGNSYDFSLDPDNLVSRHHTPLYTLDGGRPKRVDSHGVIDVYRDADSLVALQRGVMSEDGDDGLQLDGVLASDGEPVYIRHLRPSSATNHRGLHVVAPMEGAQQFDRAFHNVDNFVRSRRQENTINAVIDVLVVVDYAIYRQELQERGGDEHLALADIRRYYTLMIAMVDTRYRAITDYRFNINVRLAGVMVARQRSAASWAEYHVQRNPEDSSELILEPNLALQQFHEWLLSEASNLPDHDHAMAFTGYGLYNVEQQARTSGMAYIGSICKLEEAWSCSVVEEYGGFANVGTATHELGHSLGAHHDGVGVAAACPAWENNLMTPTNVGDNSVLANFFTFSRCSLEAFAEVLSSEQASCVRDASPSRADDSARLPGELYGADRQCQDIFGPESGVCDMADHPQNICLRMWCRKPETADGCLTTGTLHAIYGTPCGQGRFCNQGECVERREFRDSYRPQAAKAAVRCDDDVNRKYCDHMFAVQPSACAQPSIRDYCCRSCQRWRS